MNTRSLEVRRTRLAARLVKLSADAWVKEVDLLARYDSISKDEALTLLGRRFAGDYLASRRHIVWPMLEYLYLCIDADGWLALPGGIGPESSSDGRQSVRTAAA
jgi:hypothetical protein